MTLTITKRQAWTVAIPIILVVLLLCGLTAWIGVPLLPLIGGWHG